MSLLKRFLRGRREAPEVEIVSRKPIGKFKVERVLRVLARQVLIGEVLEGLIYPGYKLKGRKAGIIMKIEKERKEIDFALTGDRVALMLETEIPCTEGEILEVYQS